MRRAGRVSFVILLLPSAAGAQQMDVPSDWSWRLDGPQTMAEEQSVKPGEWRYQRMPPGWHITTTEQGVLLFPTNRSVAGGWGVEVELFIFPNPGDAGFGIALDGAGPDQFRFLMRRDGSGGALAVTAGGAERELAAWKKDSTVAAHGGTGIVKYVLRLEHEAGMLGFTLNGAKLFSVPGGGGDRTVVPGLRVGPGLNLHVSRFDLVTPLAPVPARKP